MKVTVTRKISEQINMEDSVVIHFDPNDSLNSVWNFLNRERKPFCDIDAELHFDLSEERTERKKNIKKAPIPQHFRGEEGGGRKRWSLNQNKKL